MNNEKYTNIYSKENKSNFHNVYSSVTQFNIDLRKKIKIKSEDIAYHACLSTLYTNGILQQCDVLTETEVKVTHQIFFLMFGNVKLLVHIFYCARPQTNLFEKSI